MYEDLPFLGCVGLRPVPKTHHRLNDAQSGVSPQLPPRYYKAQDLKVRFAFHGQYLSPYVAQLVTGSKNCLCGQIPLLTAFFLHLPKGDREKRLLARQMEDYTVAVLHRTGSTCYRVCTFRRMESFPFEKYGYQPGQVLGRLIEIVQYGPLKDNMADAFRAFARTLLYKNWARMNNVLRFEPFNYCGPGPAWTCANAEQWPSDYRIHEFDKVKDNGESIIDIVESGMNLRRKGLYGLLVDHGLDFLDIQTRGVWGKMGLVVYDQWSIISVKTDETGKFGMQDVWEWPESQQDFNTGNFQSPAYNGARLAHDKDVVVVSMNYRVNIFGFHGNRELQDLNSGLLDQRLAVEWVRDNIYAFGGDAKKMILFGQSAGGASVDIYSYAWTDDPIVYGIILESGSVSIGSSSPNNSASWYAASKALDCGVEDARLKPVECMRQKPFEDIIAAIKQIGEANPMSAFGPRADGKIVFSDYAARAAAGNFIKAPILVGNTDDEEGISFALSTTKGASKQISPPSRHVARQTPQRVPSLSMIGCGSHAAALIRARIGVSAWRCIYNGVYPNQDIGSKGAWHGADIGMQFGTSEFLSKKPNTEIQNKMEQIILDAWTIFAKDPQVGLIKFGWPEYDADKPTVISLGGRNDASVKFVHRQALDASC
ncbi:hypothetical protein FKW77_001629 [Venturia effusa]|uniref:Carboxylic ester hydrolase n=1 Tax=Venturia effusa TaxID=50376 RepID=A0A517LAE4_9PEZI|nr:hypothetical protein FKW77_001629 [Venturia effusa]